jgi:multisubunit Na+/H+ antiporter MnhE subunit
MNKQTLHILHVYFSQEWQLSSIIYSLLFLFCILFIVSTQIAASRRIISTVIILFILVLFYFICQCPSTYQKYKCVEVNECKLYMRVDDTSHCRKKENSILAFYL